MLDGLVGLMFQLHEEMTSLTMDESKRGGANRSFESRAVGPMGVIKLVRPVLSRSHNRFLQNRLDLTVRDLYLATSLRVVAKSRLMMHSIFLQESFQFLLYEVRPIIANEHPQNSKMRQNNPLE